VILSLETYLYYYIIMNRFESRFEKMHKKTDLPNMEIQDSLNKNIALFQDDLTQNINLQYQKEWKKLSKVCKIKLLLTFCQNENISNFNYLKKYVTKLDIEYDQDKMIILKINNIIKIENKDNSIIELQIKDLKNKTSKTSKKSKLNTIDIELVEDI
jgi:hypothetical protein